MCCIGIQRQVYTKGLKPPPYTEAMSWHPDIVTQLVTTRLLNDFKEYLMRIDARSRDALLQQCEYILANAHTCLKAGSNTDLEHILECGEWISSLKNARGMTWNSPEWNTFHTNFLSQCTPFMELVDIILHKKFDVKECK